MYHSILIVQVREDANLQFSAENIIDGVCYNSGQSCCAIERIYVARAVYDDFVAKCVAVAKSYKLGDPMADGVNLGPVISVESADRIRAQVADAVEKGATCLIDNSLFPAAVEGSKFVAPQILVGCNHTMAVSVFLLKKHTDYERRDVRAYCWYHGSRFRRRGPAINKRFRVRPHCVHLDKRR